jgi:hypothetical protein
MNSRLQNPADRLALQLPDEPRWIETRATLRRAGAQIFGLRENPGLHFVVRHPATGICCVVGTPDTDAIRRAAEHSGIEHSVLSPVEVEVHVQAALRGWRPALATLHSPGRNMPPLEVDGKTVRLFDVASLRQLRGVPDAILEEITLLEVSPIAVAFCRELPVSFCFAAYETETLWDVSIETVAGFQRRGYAARSFAALMPHFTRLGKQPVWGAELENVASRSLALKLGFVPVAELLVWRRSGDDR